MLECKFTRTKIRPDYSRIRRLLRKVRYGIDPNWSCVRARIELLDLDRKPLGYVSARGLVLRRISLNQGVSELLMAGRGAVHRLGKVSIRSQEEYKSSISGALLASLVGLPPLDYQSVGHVVTCVKRRK